MAKLKNSFKQTGKTKLHNVTTGSQPRTSTSGSASLKSLSVTVETVSKAGSVVQALGFGSLHTKATGSSSSPQWSGLLSAATSGGGSSFLGGGLLAGGTLGFIGKLLSLFGGGKSAPAAPTPFVMPAPQSVSLNVGTPGAVSSVSIGVQSNVNTSLKNGPLSQIASHAQDHAAQSSQVVQIVKQALLTSSSLNDVISEI